MSHRILILGDNPDLARFLAYPLEKRGFLCRVEPLSLRPSAARRWSGFDPHLAVLDAGTLPPSRVARLVRMLRSAGGRRRLPILPLFPASAKGARGGERTAGLTPDLDDCLSKPFAIEEFMARVDVLLRRFHGPIDEVYEAGAVKVDLGRHEVRAEGKPVRLSSKEFHLLLVLLQKAGRVLSRGYLLSAVWETGAELTTRTVDMCVCRLRDKLGAAGSAIETVPQFGYRFRTPDAGGRPG